LYRTKYRSVELVVGPAYWPTFGVAALLVFLQTLFAPLLAFRGAVPSLAAIAVVLYANRVGARRGALLAIPVGLLLDVFSASGGTWTIATTIMALAVGALSRRVFADGAFVPAILCALAVLLRDFVFWLVMRFEGYPRGYSVAHLHAALWAAALTALVAFSWLVVRGRLVVDKTTIQRYA
jgi:rod shape-determining protein MreD